MMNSDLGSGIRDPRGDIEADYSPERKKINSALSVAWKELL